MPRSLEQQITLLKKMVLERNGTVLTDEQCRQLLQLVPLLTSFAAKNEQPITSPGKQSQALLQQNQAYIAKVIEDARGQTEQTMREMMAKIQDSLHNVQLVEHTQVGSLMRQPDRPGQIAETASRHSSDQINTK